MSLTAFAARHVHNASSDPQRAYGTPERAIVNRDAFAAAELEIASWPGYAPTPLIDMGGLAGALGLGAVHYKDESKRFGLKSFKALGGAYAVLRVVQAHVEARGGGAASAAELLAGAHGALAREVTVTCATDGNHGRSVAWGAQMFGCGCVIYLHAHVSAAREREIASYGAEIVRVAGNYDDSVRQCAADAESKGRILVADTNAGGGPEGLPAMVMQGYTVMADEILQQLDGRPFSHLFIQGGVGGVAAAVGGHLWETLGADRPRVVVVEATRADCIYRSIAAGRPTPVPGDYETFMACLAAGEISPLAWPILRYCADDVITLPDEAAAEAMRVLAEGVGGDQAVVAGESGAAATAGLVAAAQNASLAERLGLDANAHVVVLGSEGATDAEVYAQVVGESAEEVARRAS